MPRFELTRYPTDNIISRLYILGFLPPELLSEKPTEVPSNSPEERILEICSLTVACLTSNYSSICFCVNHTVSNSGLNSTSRFISPSVNKTISFFKKYHHLLHQIINRIFNSHTGSTLLQIQSYLFSIFNSLQFHSSPKTLYVSMSSRITSSKPTAL